MTKRVQKLIACFLALSFALAGLVAISPTLHVAIEHGGHGQAHTHRGGPAVATTATSAAVSLHDHPHPHAKEHGETNDTEEVFIQAYRPELFVSTHRSFTLPQIPVQRLWRAFTRFLERTTSAANDSPDPAPDSNNPGHEHHSLAQLLADGLIDQCVDLPLIQYGPACCYFLPPSPQELLLVHFLDAQTAGRAPPLTWS